MQKIVKKVLIHDKEIENIDVITNILFKKTLKHRESFVNIRCYFIFPLSTKY